MKQMSSNKKSSSSNKTVKYKIDTKSNVILEDKHEHKNITTVFKLLCDKDAPFYQYSLEEK